MWKQTKCPWADQWTSTIWSIPRMGCVSALKGEDILTPATTWTTSHNIVPGEMSRPQKDKHRLHLQEASEVVSFTETERRVVGARGWGREAGGVSVSRGQSFSFAKRQCSGDDAWWPHNVVTVLNASKPGAGQWLKQ